MAAHTRRRAACGAMADGLADMKSLVPPRMGREGRRAPRRASAWLVLSTLAVIPLAVLLAWGLLHVLLAIVFPRMDAY
ncbi:hypothetical protein JCM10599A_65650 [Paraburkholderia kururiensis]